MCVCVLCVCVHVCVRAHVCVCVCMCIACRYLRDNGTIDFVTMRWGGLQNHVEWGRRGACVCMCVCVCACVSTQLRSMHIDAQNIPGD